MKTRDLMASLRSHWEAARAGDLEGEMAIYREDAVCDLPQTGESFAGIEALRALRRYRPEKPLAMEFLRILGSGNLWVTEFKQTFRERSVFVVSVMEFKGGRVFHETRWFTPQLLAPAWHTKYPVPGTEGGGKEV